jgi:hypothetical protein
MLVVMIDLDRAAPPSAPAPRSRSWPAALLAMASALLLSGAAPLPRITELRQVAVTATGSGPWLLTAETLYSTHSRPGARFDVAAWSVATGEALWQRDVEWRAEVPVITEAGAALVMVSRTGIQKTRVLDARSGRDLVDPATFTVALPAGDRVVFWNRRAGRLSLYDPAARRAVWERPSDRLVDAVVAPGGRLLVLTESDFATLTLSSGELLGRAVRDKLWGEQVSIATAAGSAAYLLGKLNLSAISLPARPQWSLTVPLAAEAVPCGERICVSGGAGLFAIDPATGGIVWDHHDWIGGENGLVRTRDGRALRVDTRTGEVQSDLGVGLPAGDLFLRPGPDGLSVVDMRTGQIRARRAGVQAGGCRRTGENLACQQGGKITVWRLP